MQHYCFHCGTVLASRLLDHREREACPNCGWVHYEQLKVGAAVIVEKDDKLLLVQRNHEPWKGSWMMPAGYVEVDEHPRDAARREVLEETGLVVELSDLIDIYFFTDDPRGNGVSFVYRAEKVSGEVKLNSESIDANYYAWNEIPSYLTRGGHDKMIQNWQMQARQKELQTND